MKVISIINEKGGAGKSTVTFNLAWAQAQQGKRVLMIDLDPQRANLTFLAGIQKDKNMLTMYHVLVEKQPITDVILGVSDEPANLHILPADNSVVKINQDNAGLSAFKRALALLARYYDYIYIDVPPTPGIAHTLAIGAADAVIMVMLPDVMCLEANMGMARTIMAARKSINPELSVVGVLINKYTLMTRLSRQAAEKAENVAKALGGVVLGTKIRNNIAIAEAAAAHEGITSYAPKSNGASDIEKLVAELEERMNEN